MHPKLAPNQIAFRTRNNFIIIKYIQWSCIFLSWSNSWPNKCYQYLLIKYYSICIIYSLIMNYFTCVEKINVLYFSYCPTSTLWLASRIVVINGQQLRQQLVTQLVHSQNTIRRWCVLAECLSYHIIRRSLIFFF